MVTHNALQPFHFYLLQIAKAISFRQPQAERTTPHTWFNAPGEKDMHLFEAGVAYFK